MLVTLSLIDGWVSELNIMRSSIATGFFSDRSRLVSVGLNCCTCKRFGDVSKESIWPGHAWRQGPRRSGSPTDMGYMDGMDLGYNNALRRG